MRIIIFALVALAGAAARLHATEYYINYVDGIDTNAGTSTGAAWKHCPGDPAATDLAASAQLKAGDVVRFKGGVTYELARAPGIELRWNGEAGNPIVYDGNSAGAWGDGRARFTDRHGGLGLSAFTAAAPRQHLRIASCEFGQIGGAAALPADAGAPMAPRFGGGITLAGGAENIAIERCVFREIGYWFNSRPMGLGSIAGAAVASASSLNLQISDCVFSRVARACDFSRASALQGVKITRCQFGEAIAWPLNIPGAFKGNAAAVDVSESDTAADGWFDRERWSGYGEAPLEALRIVASESNVTLQASAIGNPAPAFQWRKNGFAIPGATQATLQLNRVSLTDAGIYVAVATNAAGSTASNAAVVVVVPKLAFLGDLLTGGGTTTTAPASVAPAFTLQPVGQTLTAGQSATLQVAATGTPAPTLQWRRNGTALAGATGTTLNLVAVTSNEAGDYTVVATNVAGAVTSQSAAVNVLTPPPSPPPPEPSTPPPAPAPSGSPSLIAAQLLTAGAEPAAVEFTLPEGEPRKVLVRAVGPTLTAFRLVGVLADPRLELFAGGTRLAENNNWGGDETVRAASAGLTVFPLADGTSADAALLITLGAGTYRATVSPATGAGGLVWIDVYEFR